MSPCTPFKCWQRETVSVQAPSSSCYFHGKAHFSSSTLLSLDHLSDDTLTLTSPLPLLPWSVVLSLVCQSVILCDALSSELFQDVVEVSRVGEAMSCQVGSKLCLVVDLEERGEKKMCRWFQ